MQAILRLSVNLKANGGRGSPDPGALAAVWGYTSRDGHGLRVCEGGPSDG